MDAVTPLTGAEVTEVMTAQSAASEVWDAAFAELGNTKKARKAAVAGILELPGVANAGLAADGANIFIEYTNGLSGGLDLDPVGDPDVATLARSRRRRRRSEVPALATPVGARHFDGGSARRQHKVLIWSAFENENSYQPTRPPSCKRSSSDPPVPSSR